MQNNIKSKPTVLMFGPALTAKSGISAVVNNWIEADIEREIELIYVPTLSDFIAGKYLMKLYDAGRAFTRLLIESLKPIDIVHIHFSGKMSFYRKLVIFVYVRLRQIKVIVHLHSGGFKSFYNTGPWYRKKLIKYMFDHSDAVFVLSSGWSEFVGSLTENRSIHIISNGASVVKFNPNRKKEESQDVLILFMGKLSVNKGIYDLIEAFQRLNKDFIDARLVLGGSGDTNKIKALIEKKGIGNRVDVLGWVSGKRKNDIYENADIFVLPSYFEGLPGSMLEAMAAGTAIVSTNVGAIPEIVKEGWNGYLIESGDIEALYVRLLILCRNKNLRYKMGRESRRIIEEKYDINKIVEELVTAYREILAL